MSAIADDVGRIAQWVARQAEGAGPMFAAGAPPEAVLRGEASLGLAFPDEVRALYAVADGQTEDGPSLLDAFRLMPLSEVVDSAAFLNDFFPDGRNEEDPDHEPIRPGRGIRPTWWWPRWVPIMTNGSGDYYCVDLDPAEGGSHGQILAYFHDETFRPLIAASVAEILHRIAEGLESGLYAIDDDMIVETAAG